MPDHFTLDVDVDALRHAKLKLGELAQGFAEVGPRIQGRPADLESWSGPASTKIKAEMTALGTAVGRFSTSFGSARDAVSTFVDAVVTFQEGPLATANREWDRANRDAEGDLTQAGRDFADDEEKLGARRGEIAMGLRWTLQAISYTYGEERELLAQKARTLGTTLGGLSPVTVPESVATRFLAGGGTGTRLGWCDQQGTFPPDLDGDTQIDGLTLAHDLDDQVAGQQAADRFNDDFDPEDADDLLAQLDGASEAFRNGFVSQLDPAALREFQRLANLTHDEGNREEYGALVTAVAQILATASTSTSQPNYPVSPSVYDDLVSAYTDFDQDFIAEEGYLMLAELVAAGQGDQPRWDSGLLADISRQTIEYEQGRLEDDPYFTWVESAHNMTWATEVGQSWFGHAPGQGDPIMLLQDALGEDTTAAQDVLTSGGSADTDLLHYLYSRTTGGNYLTRNMALGEMLTAATTPVGAGGEGTPEYVSAEIVADLVHYYATHDTPVDGLEEAFTDILTTHVQAVNHAGQGYEGAVSGNNPNGILPFQQIALANLSSDDLQTLLTRTFALDYYSNEVARDDDPDAHSFPLYTQLALAMELAARDDVIAASQSGEAGLLERVVNDLSRNQELASNSFVDALDGEGAERDQANADARAGLDFVLGIVKDQVPTGSGVGSSLAGAGLDRIQSLLVDAIIPESAYQEGALADADLESYRRRLVSLKLVQWLDEAGTLPQEHSPQQWALENPDRAGFLDEDGHILPLDQLYQDRKNDEESTQAWDDFIEYYQSEGGPWLAELDLDEQFTLGWLESDSGR